MPLVSTIIPDRPLNAAMVPVPSAYPPSTVPAIVVTVPIGNAEAGDGIEKKTAFMRKKRVYKLLHEHDMLKKYDSKL